MRSCLYLCFGLALSAVSWASPPVSGGFMTGADSAVIIFWFHPEVHAYEQGIDGEFEESILSAGDVPGQYSMAQKAAFPFMSFIETYLIKIYGGDIVPSLPGDQFSPFGYSIYRNGDNGLPEAAPIWSGVSRLGVGEPCDLEWAEIEIDRFNPGGEDWWFGFDWADSTPSAPQIKCVTMPQAELYNKFGVGAGEYYNWSDIQYGAVFRYRFMTPFPADSFVNYGWRREIIGDNAPDSFHILCYISGSDVPNEYYAAADSLFGRIPAKNIDSVAIASCYDDAPENEFLILRYVEDKAAPVVGEILPDKNDPTESNFELCLDNIGADSAALILGYDSRYIEGEVREIVLSGFGSAVVPFQVTSAVSDSMELMIVIQDRELQYYPHLVHAFYPLQNPTDAAEGAAVVPDRFDLKIYPNPGRDNFKISGTGLRRATKAEVCNILGQRVAEISLYPDRDAVWDGRNAGGESMPSGIYFIRIFEARSGWLTRRLVLMR